MVQFGGGMTHWRVVLLVLFLLLTILYMALATYEALHRRPCALCDDRGVSDDGIPCPFCSDGERA
jgi:hypothetical protein